MKIPPPLAFVLLLACGATPLFSDPGDQPPKPTNIVYPECPEKMLQAGDGQVVLRFAVSTAGTAEDVSVAACSRPEMEAPAIDAVLKAGFSPGIRGGVPVRMYVNLPIWFKTNYNDPLAGGDETMNRPVQLRPWKLPDEAPAGVPPQFQYDKAPEAYLILPAVYPRDMLLQKVTGWATVVFAIDPRGRARSVTVKDASRPEFGPPAASMIASWRFTPPRKQGQPCWALAMQKQEFETEDEFVETDENTNHVLRELRKDPCPIVAGVEQLDAMPEVLYAPRPALPEGTVRARASAQAVVEVVIDEKGHAQVPRIVSASREDFGWAAAAAAGRWHFSIPKKGGQPVDVFARIPFRYNPPVAVGQN